VKSTSDLDREVRDLLRERASAAGEAPPFQPAVHRRVRSRQAAALASGALVIAIVVLPFVVAPALFEEEGRVGETNRPAEPVTSSVYGVSITYPDDWTLLQLNGQLEMDGTETSSLFQLSNFDPLDDRIWVCPLPQGGSIPEGGVVLFVQEILTDLDAPSWPVDLAPGAATFDTCGRRVARWEVDGRTFEAGVVGDLDGAAYDELTEAFRSMTFEAPDDDPPLGFYDVTVGHAYILASGRENAETWNLLAFRYHDVGSGDDFLCVLFDASDPPDGRCEPDPVTYDLEFVLSAEEAGGTLFSFGTAPAGAGRVETLTGRSLQLHPLPDGLRIYGRRIPLDAFVGRADELVADGVRLVEVRIVDSGGAVIDRRQWIEPPSVDGAPSVIAFDHAFGELWWLFDDGEQILLKTRAGVIHAIGERLLPPGEHLRVWTHTFTRDTDAGAGSETVVYGLSSGEGAQITLLLTTGEVIQASVRILEAEILGPDLIPLSSVFSVSIPGSVRGEVVAVSTGCVVLARMPLRPDTPPPSLPSPPPEPELPCIGP